MDQPKRLLRSRRKMKSPEKDLILLSNHLSPRSRKSVVMVKRLSTKKEKVPIYKRSLPEHSAHNGSEIYEFNFDINDSKERLSKKRRRKIATKKALVNKKKKNITSKKQTVKKVVNKEAEANNVPLVAPKENNVKSTRVIMQEHCHVGSKNTNVKSTAVTSKNNVKRTDVASKETEKKTTDEGLLQTGNCMKPINENQLPANAEKNVPNNVELSKEPLVQSSLPETASTELLAENVTKKPKVSIRSVQVFNNKVITTDNLQISKLDDFRPFRPTNIFNNKFLVQQRNALSSSLFEKSLSPITKISENTELNSPWRSPPIRTFSQVRNVFQSTPQNMKQEISSKRSLRTITNESKNYENAMKRKSSLLENNENMSPGYINTNHSRKKNSTISRKFGTVITNIDSVQSNLGKEISGRLSMEVENTQSSIQLSNRINSSVNNFSVLQSTENSVHNTSNAHTPKKNFKTETSQIQSPQNIVESMQAHACVQKENLDPQPGPSGMQKVRVLGKQRGVLLQTSLNNFLNIPDMPESTTVQTPHGIFDDISSTPISKSAKKPKISNLELKNAFGFCDDDSRQDVSPVKQKVTNDENKKPFARISISQIKNQFLSKKPEMNIQPLMNTTNEAAKVEEVPAKPKQNVLVDIANFSDTFDVHPENDESPGTNTSEIPLFYDLEPSHFIEPPRYSYKRKRNVKFSFSDGEIEEEEKEQVEVKMKRRKVDRAKNRQEHKMSKWAENINKVFSEIDQFELVVE